MKSNQITSPLLIFGILIGSFMIMSGYSAIAYKSMFGFVFFCSMLILLFVITSFIGLSKRFDQLEKDIQTEILDPIKDELKIATETNKFHIDWIEAMKEYYHTTEDDINKITKMITTKYYKDSINEK